MVLYRNGVSHIATRLIWRGRGCKILLESKVEQRQVTTVIVAQVRSSVVAEEEIRTVVQSGTRSTGDAFFAASNAFGIRIVAFINVSVTQVERHDVFERKHFRISGGNGVTSRQFRSTGSIQGTRRFAAECT